MHSRYVAVGLLILGAYGIGLTQRSLAQVDSHAGAKVAWEYKVVMLKDFVDVDIRSINLFNPKPEQVADIAEKVQARLNALGAEGWELSQELNGGLIFKRQR